MPSFLSEQRTRGAAPLPPNHGNSLHRAPSTAGTADEKIAAQYGHLAYDPKRNRFLLGDATHNGTTYLRALTIKRTRRP